MQPDATARETCSSFFSSRRTCSRRHSFSHIRGTHGINPDGSIIKHDEAGHLGERERYIGGIKTSSAARKIAASITRLVRSETRDLVGRPCVPTPVVPLNNTTQPRVHLCMRTVPVRIALRIIRETRRFHFNSNDCVTAHRYNVRTLETFLAAFTF